MKCKQCKIDFHYCSSCDYDKYCYEGYCSQKCYEQTDEWKLFAKKAKNFYDSLIEEQQLEIWSLWDNGIFIDDKWEDYLDSIILDPREE